MNEKIKILKMLEQGKINAEEAAKLLAALGQGKKKDISSGFVETIMDGVSSIVGETIGSVFSFTNGGEKEISVEKGDELFLKSVGSSINLSKHKSDDFRIKSGSGVVKSTKENSKILTKVIGGSADMLYPFSIPVSIKDVGGTIEGIGAAKFTLKQMGGSAKLSFDDIEDVHIDSKGGTVKLLLGDCNADFDILAPGGHIDFDIPADFSVREDEKVKCKIGKGKGKLTIRAFSGNVTVLPLGRKKR